MKDYEKEYDKFWKDIVEKDGVVDMDQVKKELSNYSMIIKEVSTVYMHVSGGRISNPNTKAYEVISVADEYYSED